MDFKNVKDLRDTAKTGKLIGLAFLGIDDKKYFYKSYYTKEELYKAIENDEYFKSFEKKKIIIISLNKEEVLEIEKKRREEINENNN